MRASQVACSSFVNGSNSYGIELQFLDSSWPCDSSVALSSTVAAGRVKNVSPPGTRDSSKESLPPAPSLTMSSQHWDSRWEASRERFQASGFHFRVELPIASFH